MSKEDAIPATAAMSVFKSWLAADVISADDLLKIDAVLAHKYIFITL